MHFDLRSEKIRTEVDFRGPESKNIPKTKSLVNLSHSTVSLAREIHVTLCYISAPLLQRPLNLRPVPLAHTARRSPDNDGNLALFLALDGVLVRRQPQRGRGLHAPLAVGERVRDCGEAAVHVRALGQEHPVVQPALAEGSGRLVGGRLVPALRAEPRSVERASRRR